MAISNEKRSLIVEAKLRGETEGTIFKWLNISTSSVTIIYRIGHIYRKNVKFGIKK
jgi:hypothetical protein